MKKDIKINLWDLIYPDNERSYDLQKIKIKEADKFTGDIVLSVEYKEDKS